MHELFAQVLSAKDLSKAGELFSLEDSEIEKDLEEIISRIEDIADTTEYESNDNDQSVVEICITRITTALRETEKIEKHAASLVSLLTMCLRHNLAQGPKDEDPPHAKIASDIMSRLFTYYSNSEVMSLTIPAVVKFLGCSNRDLVRNVASYLSLATIDNSRLLAQHMTLVLETVLKGNCLLGQVLPQIYDLNRGPVLSNVDQLAAILKTCESTEKVYFIQLFSKIAKTNPKLLEKHVPLLCSYLSSSLLSSLVLMTLVDMSMLRPKSILPHLKDIQEAVETQPAHMHQVAQIVGAVGTLNQEEADRSLAYLVSRFSSTDLSVLPSILHEVRVLGLARPDLLESHIDQVTKLSGSGSSAVRLAVQQIREDFRKYHQAERPSQDAGAAAVGAGTATPLSSGRSTPSAAGEESDKRQRRDRREHSEASGRDRESKDLHNTSTTTTDSSCSTITSGIAAATHKSKGRRSPAERQKKEMRSVSSQTEGTVTVITVGNPPNAIHPSGTVSVKSTALPQTGESVAYGPYVTRHSRILDHSSTHNLHQDRGFYANVGTTTDNIHGAHSIRDGVQLFCEKHFAKIKNYISNINVTVPLPAKCSVVNGKHKRFLRLHFACASQGEQCLYVGSQFMLNTRLPKLWVHLMFLSVQARSKCALSQRDIDVSCLKACWDALRSETPSSFLALVTSSFPSQKDQLALLQELHQCRYFDVFELSPAQANWACFVCNHPEKLNQLLTDGSPEIAGQLKEKKGKWMFFKRWKTRYFTLSGGSITYNKSNATKGSLPVTKIQSVKAVRKGIRDIPKAFEIFTGDQTYMFKAKSHQSVEQWVQCLHIAVARSQAPGSPIPALDNDGAAARSLEHNMGTDVSLGEGKKQEVAKPEGDELGAVACSPASATSNPAQFGVAETRRSKRVVQPVGDSGLDSNADVKGRSMYKKYHLSSDNQEGSDSPGVGSEASGQEFFRRSSVRASGGVRGSSRWQNNSRSSNRSICTSPGGQSPHQVQQHNSQPKSQLLNSGNGTRVITDTKL